MSLIRLPYLAAAMAVGLVGVSMAQADVVLSVNPITVDSPASATDVFADVVVKLTNSTPAPSMMSYNIGLMLVDNGGTGATLTGLSYNGGPFASTNFFVFDSGTSLVATNDTSPAASVADGSVMFRAMIHLDANAVGNYQIDFDSAWTSMYDGDNQVIEFTTEPAALTINAVPEPASLGLLGLAGLGLLKRRRIA